jgi:Ca2+-binding RTX toxin-like protein
MSYPPASGLFAVATGGAPDEASATRGVWLWRPSGFDHSPPVITPTVAGATGNNGWFVGDVSVSWDVRDDESAVTERVGCNPATVVSDTPGASSSCRATSEGGTSSASVVVRRDTTAPTLTCLAPEPVFELYQLGAQVRASVADATSGPAVASAFGIANTGRAGSFTSTVTGRDRAGNTGTATCPYRVIIPTCRGLTPTRVGTALNDAITGTAGRDVIVAFGGADTVDGGGGADVICGGDGPDTLRGAGGNDLIDGGASNDDIYGGAGDDTLDGGLHNDSLRGDNGRDTCTSGELRMSSCEVIK